MISTILVTDKIFNNLSSDDKSMYATSTRRKQPVIIEISEDNRVYNIFILSLVPALQYQINQKISGKELDGTGISLSSNNTQAIITIVIAI